jgi:P4 family phage/plasmid primase-like protien
MTLLDAALEYVRHGFPVFPCKLDKSPLTEHGFKDRTLDTDLVREWWTRWPDASIGVPTGDSTGFIVVDEDPRHGGTESLAALTAEFGPLPDGPVARTGGGGRHFLLQYPGGLVSNTVGFRPGLDLRAEGGYIVVAPSPHPSGNCYAWEKSIFDTRLPFPPPWLLKVLEEKRSPTGRQFPMGQDGRIPHGRHHDFIVSTAASLVSRIAGIDEGTLVRQLRAIVRESLDDWETHEGELIPAARSAMLKFYRPAPESPSPPSGPAGPGTTPVPGLPPTTTRPESPAASWGRDQKGAWPKGAEAHAMKDELRRALLALPIPPEVPPLWNVVGEGAKEHEEPNRLAFVTALQKTYSFITLRDTGEVLLYDRHGVYNGGALAFMGEWIEMKHRERDRTATQRFVAESVDSVKRSTYLERDSLNPPGRLCLNNGVLDLDVSPRVKVDHSPDHHFVMRLPVDYDPDATCPNFLKFLSEVLPQQDKQDVIQEMFGYCLRPGNPYKVAFFLMGEFDSGKSTLLEVLRGLLGDENTSTIALQSLADNRFASAGLFSKLANIYTDLSPRLIKDVGLFKMLTGGSDHVPAEKKFQAPFAFVNPAKLIFSANALPAVPWGDDAFFRRWVTLEFGVQIPQDRQVPFLESKLLEEAPGILNWALAGLDRLLARGRFPDTGSVEETRQRWRRLSDSLAWFAEEVIIRERGSWVAKNEFYATYAEFCEDHGVEARSQTDVGIELPHLVPGVHATVAKPGGRSGKSVRVWMGVRLKASGLDEPVPAPSLAGSTGSTDTTPISGITPTRVERGVMLGKDVEQVEHVEREPPRADPEDLFDGQTTRADRARERLGEAEPPPPPATSPPSPPTPPEAARNMVGGIPGTGDELGVKTPPVNRPTHPNCTLCTTLENHVCYACPACRWYDSHGKDEAQ